MTKKLKMYHHQQAKSEPNENKPYAAENIRISFLQENQGCCMLQDIFNHSARIVTKRYIGISQDEIDQAIDEFSL